MTQPYMYDESSTFQYDESSSFQYSNEFQPYDTGYHDYQLIGSAWSSANEHLASTAPPLYEEISYPLGQEHLQSAPSQPPLLQQDLGQISIGPYGPMYGYPIAFEAPHILPYNPKSPTIQTSPVEFSPVSDTDTVPSLPPSHEIIAFEWRNNESTTPVQEGPKPSRKRKAVSIAPTLGRISQHVKATIPANTQQASSSRSLEDCMGLFDNTLTATKEKRRRKVFSAQEKKVVKSVRTVGACIQCKFRKKTCSAGNPCPYCARLAGTLGTQLCQRESPFVERSLTQYYPSTSRRRILDFRLSTTKLEGTPRIMYIDGAGPITRPLCIEVLVLETEKLELEDRTRVLGTAEAKHKISGDANSLAEVINVLKPGSLSSIDLENWAVDYTCKYSKMKLPHATGFIFGIEYVKKGLPHSDLVNKITRLVSINFILRAGVSIISGSPLGTRGVPSPFRTIQAEIDTLLFESFRATEKSLARDLQRLVFRSSGSLARDAIVPVCLCVWQLSRLQCMLASHLTNRAAHDTEHSRRRRHYPPRRDDDGDGNDDTPPAPSAATSELSSQSNHPSVTSSPPPAARPLPADTPRARQSDAENFTHGLNLLLCTFEALFRNACPLLLDWSDPFSKDLLGNDEELLALARKMGRTLRGYREKGHSRKFRLGFGYDEEMSGRIRGLLRER